MFYDRRVTILCILLYASSIQPCIPDCMVGPHTPSREGQTSSQGTFGGLSGGLCCAKWSVQKRRSRKDKNKQTKNIQLYTSFSTLGKVTPHRATELQVAKSDPLGWGPSSCLTSLRDLNPAWLCEKPDACMCGSRATSLFLIHANNITTNDDVAP